MKLLKIQKFAVSIIFLCFLSGCGPKEPADFPQLQPFKVKIVDGDKPIEGVLVQFLYDKNPLVSAMTDSHGIAVITTTYQKYTKVGAPVGEYRVKCTKDPLADHWKTEEEREKMSKEEEDAYLNEWIAKCAELPREIPEVWSNFDKTPLTVSVQEGGGEVTFDVDGHAN